jgi:hypothetical protein
MSRSTVRPRSGKCSFSRGASEDVDVQVRKPGLVDALFEVGKERQQILSNLRSAFEKKDLESVLHFVGQLIGLEKKLEGPSEKGH